MLWRNSTGRFGPCISRLELHALGGTSRCQECKCHKASALWVIFPWQCVILAYINILASACLDVIACKYFVQSSYIFVQPIQIFSSQTLQQKLYHVVFSVFIRRPHARAINLTKVRLPVQHGWACQKSVDSQNLDMCPIFDDGSFWMIWK